MKALGCTKGLAAARGAKVVRPSFLNVRHQPDREEKKMTPLEHLSCVTCGTCFCVNDLPTLVQDGESVQWDCPVCRHSTWAVKLSSDFEKVKLSRSMEKDG